ncbi:MAG: type III PLP-dependent enzyme [Mycolicibacterium cosmeticum]|nr:type III PLP-dependent enzyme [Mycolicibacterium cosmeticum]
MTGAVADISTSSRLQEFVDGHTHLPTPYLVMDLDIVAQRYDALRDALPQARIFYAVKANPAPEVLRVLAAAGSSFDVASIGEIDLCRALGIAPERLSFGNTVKKEAAIAAAYAAGVRTFAVDAPEELDKLTLLAPRSTLLIRLVSEGGGADWPLSRKFGTTEEAALTLMRRAVARGHRVGVSFHVGSQQREPQAWDAPLAATRRLRDALRRDGHDLVAVNLGGGLPSHHAQPTPPLAAYGEHIRDALRRHGMTDLDVMTEPGRFLVGDAGVIRAEVVLATAKPSDGGRRWVYLDIGMFNGLVETQEEAIRYRITCPGAVGDETPAVLAGPTCDSLDILYERVPYPLPAGLRAGDPVEIHSTGAYTTSYSSVGFNGIEPLRTYHLSATHSSNGELL